MQGFLLAVALLSSAGAGAQPVELFFARKTITITIGSIILQTTPDRTADLPEVPSLGEIGNSAEDRQVLALYASGSAIGRSLIGPPGIPPERLVALRSAFMAMVVDPEFLADIRRLDVELAPLPGEQVAVLVARTLAVPEAVRERARLAFGR